MELLSQVIQFTFEFYVSDNIYGTVVPVYMNDLELFLEATTPVTIRNRHLQRGLGFFLLETANPQKYPFE